MRYDELEAAILDNCEHLRPDQVLPNPDEQDAACHAIRQRLAGRDAELQDMEQRAANLLDQIERTTDAGIRDRYETRLRQLGGQKADLERQRADDETELRRTERNLKSFTKWQRDLDALRQALADGDPELRMRCAAHLRQFIDRIEVFAVGYQERADPDAPPARPRSQMTADGKLKYIASEAERTENFAEQVEAVFDDAGLEYPEGFAGFLDYVTKRRMSKEGRFYRIHYRTGATVDVVPPGSLATGLELVRDDRRKAGWRFVRPSIDRLWREYEANRHAPRHGADE